MRVALFLPTVLLAGCAFVATTTFDPVEYDRWIEVTHSAQTVKRLCKDPEIAGVAGEALHEATEYALLYSSTKIKSDRITVAAQIVDGLVNDFNKRYDNGAKPSKAYCELKTTEIETAAKSIAASIAKKEM